MQVRRSNVSLSNNRNQGDGFKDEVYRHMFRLEAHRRGAERDLAIALLRAWMAADGESNVSVDRMWLRKICQICLVMIESASPAGEPRQPSDP